MNTNKARAALEKLKDKELTLDQEINFAKADITSARMALGATLAEQMIGTATAEDVAAAREQLATNEQHLTDLAAMATAIPEVKRGLQDIVAVENRELSRQAQKARLEEFEEAFEEFQANVAQMVRNNTIEQQGRKLYGLASKARQGERLRTYFKSMGAKAGSLARI